MGWGQTGGERLEAGGQVGGWGRGPGGLWGQRGGDGAEISQGQEGWGLGTDGLGWGKQGGKDGS